MTGSYVGKAKGGKLIRLELSWTQDRIDALRLRGDFFAHPEDGFEAVEASLPGCLLTELGAAFARGIAERGVSVFGLLPEDLDDAARAIVASASGKGA
jgi:hypothetical protein